MSASAADGITRVSVPELVRMRARAARTRPYAAHVHTPLAGAHVSPQRGRGMDYAESRAYQPGDDVRHIDWRRTARSGKWHTKVFQAEREHSLLLLVDTHATMRFGTRRCFKSVAAARAAAWLTWTAIRGGDRVGTMAFGSARGAVDPRAGNHGALAVLGALGRWDHDATRSHVGDDAGEDLSTALERVQRLGSPGSRVVLLSDGWCTDTGASTALARLGRRAALRVVVVADALERELAPAGVYEFQSGAYRRTLDLGVSGARERFRERLGAGCKHLADACDRAGVPWCTLDTRDEPERALTPLLAPLGHRP